MTTTNNDNTQITVRFFQALDHLISEKVIRGLKTFTDRYDINRRGLISIRDDKENKQVKPVWLSCLVRDFGVSADWLLLGTGDMFTDKVKLPVNLDGYTPVFNKEFVMEGVVRIYVEKGAIKK